MVHITHPLFWDPRRHFPYPPTDAHPSQAVDNDNSISGPVDKALTEVGYLESRTSKMDIDDLLRCRNKHADDCRI